MASVSIPQQLGQQPGAPPPNPSFVFSARPPQQGEIVLLQPTPVQDLLANPLSREPGTVIAPSQRSSARHRRRPFVIVSASLTLVGDDPRIRVSGFSITSLSGTTLLNADAKLATLPAQVTDSLVPIGQPTQATLSPNPHVGHHVLTSYATDNQSRAQWVIGYGQVFAVDPAQSYKLLSPPQTVSMPDLTSLLQLSAKLERIYPPRPTTSSTGASPGGNGSTGGASGLGGSTRQGSSSRTGQQGSGAQGGGTSGPETTSGERAGGGGTPTGQSHAASSNDEHKTSFQCDPIYRGFNYVAAPEPDPTTISTFSNGSKGLDSVEDQASSGYSCSDTSSGIEGPLEWPDFIRFLASQHPSLATSLEGELGKIEEQEVAEADAIKLARQELTRDWVKEGWRSTS